MKKFLAMAVAAIAFTSASALDYEPKSGVSFQVLAGFDVSNLNGTELNAKVGGDIGARVLYFLPKAHGTYLTGGVEWFQKGARRTWSDGENIPPFGKIEASLTYKQQLHYLAIPIHVGFHYNFNERIGVFGEFGPYFAVGVGGSCYALFDADGPGFRDLEEKYSWDSFQSIDETKESFDPYRVSYRRWDAGLGFRVGAEYNRHYSLMLGCDWGLTDLYRQSYRDFWAEKGNAKLADVKNFNFSLQLGYRF